MPNSARRPTVGRHSPARVALAASATLTVAVMPVFLWGALSDQVGDDLGFGSTRTGLAITIFFVASALTAVAMGRITDLVGATISMRLGISVTAVVLVLFGTVVDAWWQAAATLALAGCVIGLIDTAGARAFADAVDPARQGAAFGVKEASVPAASLLAGVSIPLLASGAGWRPTFLVAVLLVPLAWWLVPGGLHGSAASGSGSAGRRGRASAALVVFALGVGAAAAASSAASTLFVPALTDGGLSESAAGLVLAVGSVGSIAARVGVGWVGDRAPERTPLLLRGAILVGCVGAALLVTGSSAVVVPAALMLLGAGWGWSGLAFLLAVRTTPDAPATAAGIVLTGLAGGGAVGPAAFGALADAWSYRLAWTACAISLAVGAALIAGARLRPAAGGAT